MRHSHHHHRNWLYSQLHPGLTKFQYAKRFLTLASLPISVPLFAFLFCAALAISPVLGLLYLFFALLTAFSL